MIFWLRCTVIKLPYMENFCQGKIKTHPLVRSSTLNYREGSKLKTFHPVVKRHDRNGNLVRIGKLKIST
jgi:hypothetical protein